MLRTARRCGSPCNGVFRSSVIAGCCRMIELSKVSVECISAAESRPARSARAVTRELLSRLSVLRCPTTSPLFETFVLVCVSLWDIVAVFGY